LQPSAIGFDLNFQHYEATLETVYDGFATADLAGPTRTDEFTNEVIRRVRTKVEVWSSLGWRRPAISRASRPLRC